MIYSLSILFLLIFVFLTVVDIYVLFGLGSMEAVRTCNERFSNGDANEVTISTKNTGKVKVRVKILDDIPYQFQVRKPIGSFWISPNEMNHVIYALTPTYRGEHIFGNINLLLKSFLGLTERRVVIFSSQKIKVYPSFLRLHQYELMAISRHLFMQGQKKVRKVGTSKEFDTIREYVIGDDPRHINWAATARSGSLKSNHYMDERSQNVFCLIDKSRVMKMPFDGMILLDYAINASLVISDVALKRGDKTGLITYEDRVDSFVDAANKSLQLHQIMESLYRLDTSFNEVNLEELYQFTRSKINQRSLLLLFSNYESIHSLRRQVRYLKLINNKHLLLVIFFRNNEVDRLLSTEAENLREIYDQSIAYQMLEEKKLIREELNKAGIANLYTSPENLNVDVINKYIEIKTKRVL